MKRLISVMICVGLTAALAMMTGCPKKAPKPEPKPVATPATTEDKSSDATTQTPDQIWKMKIEKAREALSSSDVYFDYDKSDIKDDSRTELTHKAKYMNENADIRVTIEGHCDERGSNEYNLGLGERRAASVKKFLVGQGVKETNIDTITYGEEKPVCFEKNESCWSKNRRAHFAVNE